MDTEVYRRIVKIILVLLLLANAAAGGARYTGIWVPLSPTERTLRLLEKRAEQAPPDAIDCPQPTEPALLRVQFNAAQFGDYRKYEILEVHDLDVNNPSERKGWILESTIKLVDVSPEPWQATMDQFVRSTVIARVLEGGEPGDLDPVTYQDRYTFDGRCHVARQENWHEIEFLQYPDHAVSIGESWSQAKKVPANIPPKVQKAPPKYTARLVRKAILNGREVFEVDGEALFYFPSEGDPIPVKSTFHYYSDAETGLFVWLKIVRYWGDDRHTKIEELVELKK